MSPVPMARSWSVFSEVSLVGLQRRHLCRGQGHDAGRGQAVELVGVDRSDLARRQRRHLIRGQGLDVVGVQASQGARGDGAQVGGLQLAQLSGGQRRDLVGVQGPRTGPCPGRSGCRWSGWRSARSSGPWTWAVVNLLSWSVVSTFRLPVDRALTCGALVSDEIWALVSDCSWFEVRALT